MEKDIQVAIERIYAAKKMPKETKSQRKIRADIIALWEAELEILILHKTNMIEELCMAGIL